MEAIVLAGGIGTRMSQVLPGLPKPMAPIGERPFLEILLRLLARKGFQRVVLSLGFMADKIVKYFGGELAGMELAYVIEDVPLGTGGAARMAMEHCTGDHVFVMNGDTYLDLEVMEVERFWQEKRWPIIVGRQASDTSRFGRLLVSEGRVVAFLEKGIAGPGLCNAGCYVLNRGQLDGFAPRSVFSLETDFLAVAAPKEPFGLFVTRGLFIDIGVPADYARAKEDLADQGQARSPALFLDRDGVVNEDYGYVHRQEDFAFIDGVFDVVASAKRAGYWVVVVTNQSGIGRGFYSEDDFHRLMEWVSAQFVQRGGAIDKVYFSPDLPDSHAGSRKPSPAMILQAVSDLDIDLPRSVLVGDKKIDIEAGIAAGVGTLLYLGSEEVTGAVRIEHVRDVLSYL